ncbi:MAG TPA: VWA domain-containing protein, partial [Candidatus Polarisedimenticolaceae bacterium]|nr:VWA domain-containing protein [Candidatus Polarisedimenticolaceae bacterium]
MQGSFRSVPLVALLAGRLAAAAAGADPIARADVDERVGARLYSVRLAIRPTWTAGPGACLELDERDLRVRLRGDRVPPERIELDRERQPTLHALLIDTSDSVAGDLDHIRRAATGYVERLDPGRDRAMIVTFDDSVLLHQPPTRDRHRLRQSIERLRTGAGTSLHDGLYYVVRELSVQRERPVIILLSDGFDTSSVHERGDVLDVLDLRPDLTVFSIGFDLPPMGTTGPTGMLSIRKFLQQLAGRTDGRFFDAPTGGTLDDVYRRIHETLAGEAVLRVDDPEPDLSPGELRVGVGRDGCRVEVYRDREAPDDPLGVALSRPYADLPAAFELPPDPRYRQTAIYRAFHRADPACRTGETDRWEAESDWRGIRGCVFDVAMDTGALYDPF